MVLLLQELDSIVLRIIGYWLFRILAVVQDIGGCFQRYWISFVADTKMGNIGRDGKLFRRTCVCARRGWGTLRHAQGAFGTCFSTRSKTEVWRARRFAKIFSVSSVTLSYSVLKKSAPQAPFASLASIRSH